MKEKRKGPEAKNARRTLRNDIIKRCVEEEKKQEALIKQIDAIEMLTAKEALTLEMQLDLFDRDTI